MQSDALPAFKWHFAARIDMFPVEPEPGRKWTQSHIANVADAAG
jgi:hypothetical protein